MRVALKDLGIFIEGDVDRKRALALRTMRSIVRTRGLSIAVEEVGMSRPRPPVDRGRYRQSFLAIDTRQGISLINTAPYAGVIEEGRRPGARMPPLAVIEAWVRRKLAWQIKQGRVEAGRALRGTRHSGAFIANAEDAVIKRTALNIARKIAARGLPAHKILARTKARLEAILRTEIQRALDDAP